MTPADWFIFTCVLIWGVGTGFVGFAFGAWRRKHHQLASENAAWHRGFRMGFHRALDKAESDPADWWKN